MIPAIHDSYRREAYPDTTEHDFVREVCNEGRTLPVRDYSPLWHMPVCWLGDNSIELEPVMDRILARRFGWKRLKYLFVITGPSPNDIENRQALSKSTFVGKFLREQMAEAGIDPKDVLVTHLCRFALPDTIKSYSSKHKTDGIPYLMADVENIRPSVIVALGADTLKAFKGRNVRLDTYRGNIVQHVLQDGTTIPIIPTINPLAFKSSHANLTVFHSELVKAKHIADGGTVASAVEVDYRVCNTLESVQKLVSDIRAAKPRHIAFDTEFGNDVAREEFSYTLSIQLAWAKGCAAVIPLRTHAADPHWVVHPYGKSDSEGIRKVRGKNFPDAVRYGVKVLTEADEKAVWTLLTELFSDKTIRLDGQNLRVDINQFYRNGYDIDDRTADGFDTMLAHHLLYGDEDQGLDHLVRKYVPEFGAYWQELEEWLGANGRKTNIRFGYRNIPPRILFPYGLRDADATWQIAEKVEEELNANETLKNLYWNHVSWTSLHLMDVERNGLLVDRERRQELHDFYDPLFHEMLAKFRESINWPEFNPRSKDHIASLLFSTAEYKGKKAAPADAKVLSLDPLYNTDKYPRLWSEIQLAGEELQNTPSTKATVLEVMASIYKDVKELQWLKHISVLNKFLTTYLAPEILNEFGVLADGKGFHNNINVHGRVTTRLSQLTQTGRYNSSKANLQTQPKKQESAAFAAVVAFKYGISLHEYEKRTFDGKYDKEGKCIKPPYAGADRIEKKDRIHVPAFKSCILAPEGYVLYEADFKTAEVFVWAYSSGDKDLIDVVDSGRDIHSEVACINFKLPPLEEMRAALDEFKTTGNLSRYTEWAESFKKAYGAERVSAKAVLFGIMYGRSAKALWRELTKQGVKTTPEACQAIIDGIAKMFPVAWAWLIGNSNFAVENEYLATNFGRRRYFTGVSKLSEMDKSAVRREAKNSVMQSTVADLLAQAGINLYKFKKYTKAGQKMDFKILLPIHDAFLFEVKNEHADKFEKVIKLCMSDMNLIPGTPHKLGVDIEKMYRWGEKIKH